MRLTLSAALTFAVIATAAAAQATPPDGVQVTYSGFTKLENLSMQGQDMTFLYSDMRSSLRFPLTSGVRIGADIGFNGVRVQDHLGDAIYAAGVIEGDFGKLSVGGPQLVMPQVFETPAIAGSEMTELVAGLFSGEFVRDLNLLPKAPALRGIRYDAGVGPFSLAVALHEFATTEAPLRQIALSVTGKDWDAALGMAQIDTAKVRCQQVRAAVKASAGAFTAGLSANHEEINWFKETEVEAYGTVRLSDRLSLSAKTIDIFTKGFPTHAWGVTSTYTTAKGYFLEAGLAKIDRLPGKLVNISAGYTF